MKTFGLILLTILVLLIYVVFGIQYYSIATTVVFSSYLFILLILGTDKFNFKNLLITVYIIFTLFVQWYSIRLTLKSIEIMNDNPGYFEYGSDFSVIFSWLLLLTGVVLLNINVVRRMGKNE
jgi:hypothetical protein